MSEIMQGDIVRLPKGKVLFLVVSSDYFNKAGLAVVCPVVPSAAADPLHVPVHTENVDGVVLCEDLSSAALERRGYSVVDHIRSSALLEIIYRVQSIFDYFPHAE